MIKYEKHLLGNGLRVLLHEDNSTPMVVLNIMYHVGSKNEHPDRTGFAHLFEHLMFGGSVNIPRYDEPLQKAGGENNAFTNSDITNYYLSLPSSNIETALWLESDRMLDLAFSPKSLEIQRQVVVEEFKQNYLNQPYGDAWLQLRPMAYKEHPYRWPTIGMDPRHIEEADMEQVRAFYQIYYTPTNAVLCLSGNFKSDKALHQIEKWFLPIIKPTERPAGPSPEPPATEARQQELLRQVPQDALFLAYRMCNRLDADYHSSDLISDMLGNGNSSRLYSELVAKRKMFTEIRSYITGEHDEGLFLVTGKVNPDSDTSDAVKSVFDILHDFADKKVEERELQKVKNQVESGILFSEASCLTKAINLCQAELLGSASLINDETSKYSAVTSDDIRRVASSLFRESNSNTLLYLAEKKLN